MLQKGNKDNLQEEKKLSKKEIIENMRATKNRVRGIIVKGCIIGVICIMSTYAWFTSQKDITISNLRGTVEVVESMEISLDAKEWSHEIDLSEVREDGKTVLQAAVESRNAASSNTAPNIEPRELLPVSTVGGIGKAYLPIYSGEASILQNKRLKDIKECDEIDETGGNLGIDNGYFAFDIYIKNTARDDEPDILQLNLNSAVQVLTEDITKDVVENGITTQRVYKGQAFSGLQNTIRVALALYEDTTGPMATQKEVLDTTKTSIISKVAIWEPNAPHHVEYIVDNNNKLIGSGAKTIKDGEALTTYALTSRATVAPATIDNVMNTDDPNLQEQVVLQTEMASTVKDEEDYRILSNNGKPFNLIDTDKNDFTIEANKISRLRVYVWIEGQDVDCVNLASQGGGIEVDLGLTKDDAVGNVLETNNNNNNTEPDDPQEPDNV